jgi:hypothetical protein
VVSLKEDIAISMRSLEFHEELNDASTVGSSVDIVTDEDISHRPASGVFVTTMNQLYELVHTAVDISNAI